MPFVIDRIEKKNVYLLENLKKKGTSVTSLLLALKSKLDPAPHSTPLEDSESIKKTYAHWRVRIFYSMFVGYALYYFTRKSFTFVMPALMRDLGFDKGQLGLLSTVLAISYGISKFASGIMADRSNARYFMAFGLILTGVFNIFFGLSSSLFFLALFWGLNGYFQGFGWPACARLLTHWYSQSERGRWWSTWNTSQHIGGAVLPLCTVFAAQYFGWRPAMYLSGVAAICGGWFLIKRLGDTPQSVGLPSIEKFRNDYPPLGAVNSDERELSTKEILFDHVLNNPFVWLLALSYFFVYIIRTGINDWTLLYLVETKGYSQLGAGGVIFWFEIGGIFGSLLAGWASDKIWKGARGPVNVLFCLLACFSLFAFWELRGNQPIIDSSLVFLIGFFIFGPQMLIGMAAAELAHKKAAATATGFIGWIAYGGSAVAGYPLGKIAQDFGWEGFFVTLISSAVIATLLLSPLWNVVSARQKLFSKREKVVTT